MKPIMIKTSQTAILLVASALLCFTLLQGNASAKLTATANHDHISIDTFYHGSSVSVRGICDMDTDIIVKITSPDGNTALKEKGKAAGFLWMNVDELHFANTPNLYFIHSTGKIDTLLNKAEAVKYRLGLQALECHIDIDHIKDESEKERWFSEFVKFKEQQKLYAEDYGKISFSIDNGQRSYYMLFDWPYQAQPGEYLVTVYSVKDGRVVESANSKVLVEQAGAVKYLATMAKNNGAMYGIISIVIALASGFGIGIIFKGGGSH